MGKPLGGVASIFERVQSVFLGARQRLATSQSIEETGAVIKRLRNTFDRVRRQPTDTPLSEVGERQAILVDALTALTLALETLALERHGIAGVDFLRSIIADPLDTESRTRNFLTEDSPSGRR